MKFRTAKKEDYAAIIKLWQEARLPFKPKGRDTKDNYEKVVVSADEFAGDYKGIKHIHIRDFLISY